MAYILLLLFTVTSTALISGLLYGYSCSVIEGLGKLDQVQYLSAMQSINIAIQNPLFFASFLGTLLLLPLVTFVAYKMDKNLSSVLLLGATVCYVAGVFGVTAFGNVPLNQALSVVDLKSMTLQEITALRLHFEGPWNFLHSIRTFASFTALVLSILACLIAGKT